MQPQQSTTQFRTRINYQIKVPQVRVILEDGTSSVMFTRDALQMARDAGLDLVEINPKITPPVCKIIDYGKFKYSEKKRESANKKNQKIIEQKEITFRPNTDTNDLIHKLEQAKQFLADGNKVKFTIKFRGREVTHPDVGKEKLLWIMKELTGLCGSTSSISMEGKFMFLNVSPK